METLKIMNKIKSFFSSYSKVISSIFMICYLYGILIGTYAVIMDSANLDALLVYIGGSTTIATSFYFWKAKAENLIKIENSNPSVFKAITSSIDHEEDSIEEEIS